MSIDIEADTHQFRWPRKGVGFSGTSLSVAEGRAAEAFNGHFDKPFDARILQHVVLRCTRFEDYVIGKQFGLLATTSRSCRNAITL